MRLYWAPHLASHFVHECTYAIVHMRTFRQRVSGGEDLEDWHMLRIASLSRLSGGEGRCREDPPRPQRGASAPK